MKKLFLTKVMLFVAVLLAGVETAWGQVTSASPENGKSYVVACYQSNKYYALGTASVSGKTIDGTEVTLNSLNKVNTEDAKSLTWTLEENTNSAGEFYLKCNRSNTYYYLYKNGTGNKNYNFATNSSTNKTSWSFTANSTKTSYTLKATDRGTNNVYIQCNNGTFRCYSSASDIILLEIGDVPAGPVALTSFAFAKSADAVQLTKKGTSFEARYTQTVSVEPADYDGAVTYSIDEDASSIGENTIAGVDGNGVVTILAGANEASTIVVKATGAATTAYNAPAAATYTLTVNAADLALGAPVFTPVAGAYYYGQVISVSAANAEFVNYTTDGTDPTDSSDSFPDAGYQLKGDVTLKAIAFDGELNASAIITAAYTLKAPESPTFSVAAGAVAKGTTVILTAGEGGEYVVYTTDGSTPSLSNGAADIYSEPIVINYGQTIKAVTIDGGDNESAVAEATYTLTVPTGGVYYELVTDASQLVDGAKILIASTADTNGDLYVLGTKGTTSSNNNRSGQAGKTTDGKITSLPTDAQIIELEKVGDNWYLKVGDDSYLYASSGSSNQLKAASKTTVGDNGKAALTMGDDNLFSIVFQGKNSRNYLHYNYNNGTPLFNCYASTSDLDDVQIYIQKTETPTEETEVTAFGWATYIPSYAVEMGEGVAYVVTDVDTETGDVTVESVTRVPARRPLLLKGEGTVKATILDEIVPRPAKNMLSIGTGATLGATVYPYVLAKNGGEAGFKLWTGTASVLKDRVVLLLDSQVTSQAGSRSFLHFSDGETTAIGGMENEASKAGQHTYNLNGQRVSQPTKGLYIVNGKKVFINK